MQKSIKKSSDVSSNLAVEIITLVFVRHELKKDLYEEIHNPF